MLTYKHLREYSDKSIEQAIFYTGQYFRSDLYTSNYDKKFFKTSDYYDDVNNCIDIDFHMPKIRICHRARNMTGNINDVTIKTSSKYSEDIKCEFQKLQNLSLSIEFKMLYFYCYFDYSINKITRYVIYDVKKLIKMKEFATWELFVYEQDKENQIDGGSKFNCISINTLRDKGCLLVDFSRQNPAQLNLFV